MPREVTIDFRGAPPAQGGTGADHIPVGKYPVVVSKFEDGKSSGGKRMFTARLSVEGGEQNGKRLIDRFTVEGESKFGIQRMHAFFLALGLPVKEAQFKLDLDRIEGLRAIADVEDNVIPANGNYSERTTSAPVAYYARTSANGVAAPAAGAAAPARRQAATAPAAQVAVAEPEELESVDEIAPLPTPEGSTSVESEIDDLFK